MKRTGGRLRAVGLLVAIPALLHVRDALGQEPDTAAVAPTQARGNCVLTWRGAGAEEPRTTSTQVAPGVYTHYVSGRMLWTCGSATMEADSAVNFEDRRQVDLIGNVVYQDTIRTLESRFLTYFELQDLVVAREDVELVRLSDGSRLTGPHVEFLRAVSGLDELTTAIGRPHMTLVPSGDEPGPPLEIDADRAVFAGEEEARAYGSVVLAREDLDGEADSLRILRAEERGTMWGDPWIEARDVRLEGDEIRFRSENEELTDVHAIGDGHAIGESFEVRSTRIDIDMSDEEPERVWAHGEGLSEALSGDHRLFGDSLEFALLEGTIDTAYAIGEAVAIQGGENIALGAESTVGADSLPGPGALGAPTDSTTEADVPPSMADSLAALPPDSLGLPSFDSLAALSGDSLAPPDSLELPPPDSLATTDSLALPPPDSLARPDSVAAPSPDSLAAWADSSAVPPDPAADPSAERAETDPAVAVSDSTPTVTDTSTARRDSLGVALDSAAARPDSAGPAVRSADVRAPAPGVHGAANWVRGDTVVAIFEQASRMDSVVAAGAGALEPVAAEDSISAVETLAEGALAAADSLTVVDASAAPADSASDPVMERLIAIGHARAFYSAVRDSARSRVPSRNYMIGSRIDLYFSDGEPVEVVGVEAVGVFLEPETAPTGGAPGDSLGIVADSLELPPDTLAVPSDSGPVSPDSAAAPPDTASAPPDTGSVRPGRWDAPQLEARLRVRGTSRPGGEAIVWREWAVRARGSEA